MQGWALLAFPLREIFIRKLENSRKEAYTYIHISNKNNYKKESDFILPLQDPKRVKSTSQHCGSMASAQPNAPMPPRPLEPPRPRNGRPPYSSHSVQQNTSRKFVQKWNDIVWLTWFFTMSPLIMKCCLQNKNIYMLPDWAMYVSIFQMDIHINLFPQY